MANAYLEYQNYAAIADWAERERVSRLAAVMVQIDAAPRKMVAFARLGAMYGIPAKTLERKYYRWKKADELEPGSGDLALADGRKMVRGAEENIFYKDFKTYAENDRNTCKGGYGTMLRDIRAERDFSFGTWRDLWRREFPGEAVPPHCPSEWTPRGFTYQNMHRLWNRDPSRRMALAWNRQGMFAASKHFVPVIRSRVGLHPGEVYQSDDVWHNVDVFAPGVKGVFQPLEFATYDVASAFKIGSLIKPRTLKVDPKTGKEVRDNLKQQQFRFEVAGIMCNIGFWRGGVRWVGEHRTTTLPERVLARIAAVPRFGELFHWETSGIMNTPAHKGVPIGDGGGNPRMKSLCECSHGVLHNATASLPGNRGRDAAHMHESRDAVVKYSERTIALAEKIDPALVPLLQLPILEWKNYLAYFKIIEDEVMDRRDHHLEGWADKEIVEFRLKATSDDWLPISKLADMSPSEQAAENAIIHTAPQDLMRKRRMSRREAWDAGKGELVRWPVFDACAFLDPSDVRKATVGRDGTISFTDSVYYPGERKIYLAQYRDRIGLPHNLCAGDEVWFYWCPTLPLQIWITDEKGEKNLGVAPALKTAAWVDPESIKVAVGQRQHQIAELMADTRARHAESHVARLAAENVNRALIASAKEAASRPAVEDGGERFSLDDMNAAGEVEACGDVDAATENTDALSLLGQLNAV